MMYRNFGGVLSSLTFIQERRTGTNLFSYKTNSNERGSEVE